MSSSRSEQWYSTAASAHPTPTTPRGRQVHEDDTDHGEMHEISLHDDADVNKPSSTLAAGSRPEPLRNAAHEFIFVGLVALATASPAFLQRSTMVVTASVGHALQMTPAQLAWSTAGAGLTTGAFLLPFGYIADSFSALSRKVCLVTSLLVFSLLVALASLSQHGIVLDVVSSLAGVACAANAPVAVGILSLVYAVPSRRKNVAFSSFLMGNPAATIFGGLGSGALALEMSWRAPFICLAALYGLIAIVSWFMVPNVKEPTKGDVKNDDDLYVEPDYVSAMSVEAGEQERYWPFDWVGLAILFSGVLLLTVALTIGPEGPEPWKTPTVILLLTLGLLIMGCFVAWETVTQTPMIPSSVWKDCTVSLIVLCCLFASMAFNSETFWISLRMQHLQGLSPIQVALRLLPQAAVGLFISPLVGLVMHKICGTNILAIACTCLVLSNLLLVYAHAADNYFSTIFPSLMLNTVGMDWTLNVGSLHILSSLPLHQHSIGASLLQATSRLAIPIGMAITTSVWSSYDGTMNLESFEYAYKNTFITTTVFAGLALILVPFIRIGKQGDGEEQQFIVENQEGTEIHEPNPPRCVQAARPSKRWSLGETVAQTSSMIAEKRPRRSPSNAAPSIISSSQTSFIDTPRSDTSTSRTTMRSPIVWTVCEECGTRNKRSNLHSGSHSHQHHHHHHKHHAAPDSTVLSVTSDPHRYFNNAAGAVSRNPGENGSEGDGKASSAAPSRAASTHQGLVNHNRINPDIDEDLPVLRPYGRRRFPLINRQIMTHQMLTQGFQV